MAHFLRCCLMLSCLALACPSAQAQVRQCEILTPDQQEQAQWCSAHVACRVAISVLNACADITAATKRIYDQLHASGDDTQRESGLTGSQQRDAALARLDSQPAAERKAALAKCLDHRGESGTDVCYEQFAGSEEIAQRRRDDEARILPIAWDARDKADIQQFQADDLRLVNDILDAHCDTAGKGNPAACAAFAEKGAALQTRLDRFETDIKGRRKPGDKLLTMPVLRSPSLVAPAGGAAGSVAVAGAAGAATGPAGTAAAAPDAAEAALLATLPVRAPDPQDAAFAAVVAQADVEARPRDAAEAQARAERAAAVARAEAERIAAEARAQAAQAERTRQAAADAELVERGSVGELYALADRLESGGQADAARAAYRALVRRFPDHALAASAAGRLAAIGGAPARSAAASAGSGAGAAAGTGACESQFDALAADFKRPVWSQPASNVEMQRGIMYMTQASLQLGNGACRGSPHEAELTTGMQAAHDGARAACMALAIDTSTCTPHRRD